MGAAIYTGHAYRGPMAFQLSEQEMVEYRKRYPLLSPRQITLLMEAMPATIRMLD